MLWGGGVSPLQPWRRWKTQLVLGELACRTNTEPARHPAPGLRWWKRGTCGCRCPSISDVCPDARIRHSALSFWNRQAYSRSLKRQRTSCVLLAENNKMRWWQSWRTNAQTHTSSFLAHLWDLVSCCNANIVYDWSRMKAINLVVFLRLGLQRDVQRSRNSETGKKLNSVVNNFPLWELQKSAFHSAFIIMDGFKMICSEMQIQLLILLRNLT